MDQEEQHPPLRLALETVSPPPDEHFGELRPGQVCPRCGVDKLDYDGLLNLVCPRCGLALGGCFT